MDWPAGGQVVRLGFFCTGQLNCVVGTHVSRRYILLPAIGRRGMGIVARLNKIGRLVKTLPAEIITLSLAEATFLGTCQARHRSDLVPDFGILVKCCMQFTPLQVISSSLS
jgi:hypothetical protein